MSGRHFNIPDWYEDSLLELYEDTYFPEHMDKAGKASYVERNQEMINKTIKEELLWIIH